jgi:RNA polymerase sigma-70 factor, ECF subfamily
MWMRACAIVVREVARSREGALSADGRAGTQREAEFVRLTEPHHRDLYGIALALCHDPDQAADLAQDTLVRAYEAFDRFRPGAPVRPWLRSILRNLFLDTFKTGRARHEVTDSELSAGQGPALAEMADEGVDPLSRLERAELQAWVRQEIAGLSPDHQQVLQLCVMHEMGFAEAAELVGVPVGTVASRLGRARSELRERLSRRLALRKGTDEYPGTPNSLDAAGDLGRRAIGAAGGSPGGVTTPAEMSAKVEKTPR